MNIEFFQFVSSIFVSFQRILNNVNYLTEINIVSKIKK